MLKNLVIDDEIIFQYPFKTRSQIINHLLSLIRQHDIGTARHSYKVANMAVVFAIKLKLPLQIIVDTLTAALLHDIGKIKIPRNILNKPGKLNENEFQIIKKHSQYGFEILKNINQLKHIAEVVLCHHEKINGKGYPAGKSGKEIPLIAQILSIIDVYEAITSDRIYRKAMTRKEAFQVIYDGIGTHFNSTLVDYFLLGGYEGLDFYEEIEYLIDILKKADSSFNETDALERLEKLLGEYAKTYQQQKVRRDYLKISTKASK